MFKLKVENKIRQKAFLGLLPILVVFAYPFFIGSEYANAQSACQVSVVWKDPSLPPGQQDFDSFPPDHPAVTGKNYKALAQFKNCQGNYIISLNKGGESTSDPIGSGAINGNPFFIESRNFNFSSEGRYRLSAVQVGGQVGFSGFANVAKGSDANPPPGSSSCQITLLWGWTDGADKDATQAPPGGFKVGDTVYAKAQFRNCNQNGNQASMDVSWSGGQVSTVGPEPISNDFKELKKEIKAGGPDTWSFKANVINGAQTIVEKKSLSITANKGVGDNPSPSGNPTGGQPPSTGGGGIQFLPNIPGGPNPSDITGIPDFIKYIYNLSFWVVGLAVFVNVLRGGIVVFFGAAGNASKLGEAQKLITNAIYGFILLLAAWMILNIINPSLVDNTFTFGTGVGGPGPVNQPPTGGNLPPGGGNPPPPGSSTGSWQITYYDVAKERSHGSCTIRTSSGTVIEDNADCKFIKDTVIQGTGKTLSGKFVQPELSLCKSGCECNPKRGIQVECQRFKIVTCPVTKSGECTENLKTGAANIFKLPSNIFIPALQGKRAGGQVMTGDIRINDTGAPTQFGKICSADSKKHVDHFLEDRNYAQEIRQQVPGYGGASYKFEVQGTTCGGS